MRYLYGCNFEVVIDRIGNTKGETATVIQVVIIIYSNIVPIPGGKTHGIN